MHQSRKLAEPVKPQVAFGNDKDSTDGLFVPTLLLFGQHRQANVMDSTFNIACAQQLVRAPMVCLVHHTKRLGPASSTSSISTSIAHPQTPASHPNF
eukprot:6475028-Amphidinium_carterae.1